MDVKLVKEEIAVMVADGVENVIRVKCQKM